MFCGWPWSMWTGLMMKSANDRNCDMGLSVKGFELSLQCWWQLDA